MNNKLLLYFNNLSIKKFVSAGFHNRELVVGSIIDRYLPTKFDKREKVITVFGHTSFLGEYLVHELVKHGYQLILPYRGDVHDFKHIRMIGSVGQNLFMPFSTDNDNSIELAVKNSNVVINLIGKPYRSSQCSFEELHVDIPGRIAKISKRCGVEQFIHISALGASENPKEHIPGVKCDFFKSKWFGEQEVSREFPGAAIIRPSNIWGKNDNFIFYFLNIRRRLSGKNVTIPLWKLGQQTIKQPVYAEDVAKAISRIILNDKYKGCLIETVGPQRFQLDHLIIWFYLNMKYKLEEIKIVEITDWMLFKSKLFDRFSMSLPHYTSESLDQECITDQLSGGITLDDLEIIPCKIEDRLQWLVKPHACLGYRWDNLGAFPPPPNPPLALG